jgi:methanethiol S-methyltransferase
MRGGRVFVWMGGTTFAASLAYCTWWYLFRLGRTLPRTGIDALARDAALVTIFAVHHSLFARDRVKRILLHAFGGLLRSFYVWIASALLIAVCTWWRPIGGDWYDARGPAGGALTAIQVAGVALIAWSVARIDPLALAGIREAAPIDALQIKGPYGLVRHPLYLGWMLAAFATPHLTGDRLAFAVLTSLYLVIAVPLEERSLRKAFGVDYARYAAQVPWRVIPFIY